MQKEYCDVVIPYIKNKNSDAELRYCLRGIEMYLRRYRNIYIVGDLPDFVRNVIHVPFEDNLTKTKNILNKLLYMAHNDTLKRNFIMFNDDHFLLKIIDARKVPFYFDDFAKASIKNRHLGDKYRQIVLDTEKVLFENANVNCIFYDVHTPIVINRQHLIGIYNSYKKEWEESEYGFLVKSFYTNILLTNFPETDRLSISYRDLNFKIPLTKEEIKARLKDRFMFSIYDTAINKDMVEILNELYPNKSMYEK